MPVPVPENPNQWIALTDDVLPVEAVSPFLTDAASGGICIFVGTTRQWTRGQETRTLYYEAYEAMALKEMQALCASARKQWVLNRVVLLHRLGEVGIGEASVCVGTSAAHRVDAFAATRYLIDTLKIDVPIWKREFYADGRVTWVQGDASPTS